MIKRAMRDSSETDLNFFLDHSDQFVSATSLSCIAGVPSDVAGSPSCCKHECNKWNTKMKLQLIAILAALFVLSFGRVSTASEKGKTLVIYFSHSGNTRFLAEMIHQQVEGDLVELKTVHPYPEAYDPVVDQAKREQQDNTRPPLTTKVRNMGSYSTIFIGYPNWWGTMPMALFTFLEEYDLAGKTIIPFCTDEGSRLGRSISDMKKLAPRATILEGIAIRGKSVKNKSTRTEIADWLADLHISNDKKDK